MDCASYRERASAYLDGELSGLETSALDSHLARCLTCRSWAAHAGELSAYTRSLAGAGPSLAWVRGDHAPDLTEPILAAIAAREGAPSTARSRRRRREWCDSPAAVARLALILAAIVQLGFGAIAILGDNSALAPPAAGSISAWGPTLGVGFLVAAWRPRWAVAMLPVAAILTLGLLVSAGVELANGSDTVTAEMPRILAVLGVVVLWSLWQAGRSAAAVRARPARTG